jgi:UDP-N-acetylglucosamine 4,6-dehydratase
MLNGKTILITGGTGSFGQEFVKKILAEYKLRRAIVYSRDEYKQYIMSKKFAGHEEQLRFFLGDIRDKNRLLRAFEGRECLWRGQSQIFGCQVRQCYGVKRQCNSIIYESEERWY